MIWMFCLSEVANRGDRQRHTKSASGEYMAALRSPLHDEHLDPASCSLSFPSRKR